MKTIKTTKKSELDIIHNDAYILEENNNLLITNNNEHGILLFNGSLERIETIPINHSIYIYSVFKHLEKNKLLLYCPDEELMVYIDLRNKKSTLITIKTVQAIFSNIYYWEKNNIILATYNDQFYHLDTKSHQLIEIAIDSIKINYSAFYNFWYEVKRHSEIWQVIPYQSFIYSDSQTNNIIYWNLINKQKIVTSNIATTYHDIIYDNTIFAFISEKCIWIKCNNETIQLFFENSHYIFLRARFIKKNDELFLITLLSDRSNNTLNKLVSYKIEKI